MQKELRRARGLLLVLVLFASLATIALAQEGECPQPRVEVANDIDYYNMPRTDESGHNLLALNTAVGNSIISLNSGDIRFFSAFTAEVPLGEVDYHLSVGSRPSDQGALVSIKLIDNNNRVVLTRLKTVDAPDWAENINVIARQMAQEVSPIIDDIKDHQIYIRSTTEAAISSKFEPEKRNYTVKPEEKQKISFILKDCDDATLPIRDVILELEGPGKLDNTSLTVDADGKGEFIYTAPKENAKAKVILAHKYEDVSGNDNRISIDAVDINTSGKLWLLVNHISKRAKIFVVGEHNGSLEMMWSNENTRGGIAAAFSDDEDEELWSSYFVDFIDMNVVQAGKGVWAISDDWFPGETKITSREQGGFEIEILWELEDGGVYPVSGVITYNKPKEFDAARNHFLATKRNRH